MDPVLCALDFSETSPLVLKTAADLATHYHSPLVILYSYRILPENDAIADYRKTIVKKAYDQFALLENKLGLNGLVPYEFRAEVGFLSDRIESWINANPVAFLVIGQNLVTEINKQEGITFNEFVSHSPVPVLLVPGHTPGS
ncbi:MAG: universal stress protein [Cyclobacteriaceae bacterium]